MIIYNQAICLLSCSFGIQMKFFLGEQFIYISPLFKPKPYSIHMPRGTNNYCECALHPSLHKQRRNHRLPPLFRHRDVPLFALLVRHNEFLLKTAQGYLFGELLTRISNFLQSYRVVISQQVTTFRLRPHYTRPAPPPTFQSGPSTPQRSARSALFFLTIS